MTFKYQFLSLIPCMTQTYCNLTIYLKFHIAAKIIHLIIKKWIVYYYNNLAAACRFLQYISGKEFLLYFSYKSVTSYYNTWHTCCTRRINFNVRTCKLQGLSSVLVAAIGKVEWRKWSNISERNGLACGARLSRYNNKSVWGRGVPDAT